MDRRSVRLAAADYGAPGLYFITVIAAHRVPIFGRLHRGGVALSDAGRVAHDEWMRTGDLRAAVVLDAFVVMPDHVHLLFGIFPTVGDGVGRCNGCDHRKGTACCAHPCVMQSVQKGTARCAPTGTAAGDQAAARGFGRMNPESVPSIIRAYKSAVTRAVGHAVWQRGYHDRIVRTKREATNVRRYITENPSAAAVAAARR